jgi:hypothetical protein
VEDTVLSVGLSDHICQELVVGLAGTTFYPDSRMGNQGQ